MLGVCIERGNCSLASFTFPFFPLLSRCSLISSISSPALLLLTTECLLSLSSFEPAIFAVSVKIHLYSVGFFFDGFFVWSLAAGWPEVLFFLFFLMRTGEFEGRCSTCWNSISVQPGGKSALMFAISVTRSKLFRSPSP